ncbi:MAG: exodeoxyribonuclease V subunit gamma [Lachnospiraceae bacterium]|nr:exodeoxyribonuclease V subunit gamma [Lachnospiraceae bacterium]
MSLRFVIGPSGAGKSHYVYEDVLKRARAEAGTRFLVIVPDQFTMHTQKTLCRLSPSGGILNVEVLSFGRLSHRVFEELGIESLPRLDDTGKNLILRALAAEHREELSIVGAQMRRTGYIAQVKSMISEFAQYGLSPARVSEMAELAEGRGALAAKLKDLALLYGLYQEYIRGKYITVEENIDILVRNAKRSRVLRDAVLVFDGFTGFTPIQEQLLRELMTVSREVIVTLLGETAEDVHEEPVKQKLFYLSAKTHYRLTKIAEEAGVAIDEDVVLSASEKSRHADNPVLAHLSEHLFRVKKCEPYVLCPGGDEARAGDKAGGSGEPDRRSGSFDAYRGEDGGIEIWKSQNPKAEVEFVTTEILRLIRTKGYCYRDFAVITAGLEEYGHLLAEEFALREIPLFLDQNASLMQHPLIIFLQSLLRIAVSDFAYEPVMTFLRCGYCPLPVDAIDRFELYLRRYGIRGMRRYKKPFAKDVPEDDVIQEVRAFVYDTVLPFTKRDMTAPEYTEALYDTCLSLHVEEHLLTQAKAFEEAGDAKRAKVYEQVYQAILDLFDQIHSLLPDKMECKDYLEVLKAGFAELHVGIIPQTVDQVTAGDLERTRLKPVKVLFVIGANDGLIPKKNNGGGLLSDMERSFFADMDIDLAPTTQEKSFEERIYLYMNMTQPTERLYLSYSMCGTDGKARQASYIVGLVQDLYADLSVRDQALLSPVERVEGEVGKRALLTDLLRDYAAGYLEEDDEKTALLLALLASGGAELFDAAFYSYEAKRLTRSTADRLYGEMLHTSVSRLERFAECAYAHFLSFGCKLKEVPDYALETSDLGTVYHGVLEGFGGFLRGHGYRWEAFPEEEAFAYVDAKVDELSEEIGKGVLWDGMRNRAMLARIKSILKTTIKSLSFHLAHDGFAPYRYEWKLKKEGIVGFEARIDRLDLARTDDAVYAKVLDYKSGEHTFDHTKFYYGLDLQLAVYMNMAMQELKREFPDTEVIPAGMFYYEIKDPVIDVSEGMTEEKLESEKRKELRVRGLGNDSEDCLNLLDTGFANGATSSEVLHAAKKKDGGLTANSQTVSAEDMEKVLAFADKKVGELGVRILDGEVTVDPYVSGNGSSKKTACDYCPFRSVCGWDVKLGYKAKILEEKCLEDIVRPPKKEGAETAAGGVEKAGKGDISTGISGKGGDDL